MHSLPNSVQIVSVTCLFPSVVCGLQQWNEHDLPYHPSKRSDCSSEQDAGGRVWHGVQHQESCQPAIGARRYHLCAAKAKAVQQRYQPQVVVSHQKHCSACCLLHAAVFRVTAAVFRVTAAVDLTQTPEDDPLRRCSCVWKADELITVGAWV